MLTKTREPQYGVLFEHEAERLGPMTGLAWAEDPKRLAFTAARYLWVAKMLEGSGHVLEIGCGDAFFTRIVQQAVRRVTAVDFDPVFVADVKARMSTRWDFAVFEHDMRVARFGCFDAIYALDVLEHIDPSDEAAFLYNCANSLLTDGTAIFGCPSLESQHLASEQSRAGHVNCQSGPNLKKLLERFFGKVRIFSMNDTIVHTGHQAMAHYLFALCEGVRV